MGDGTAIEADIECEDLWNEAMYSVFLMYIFLVEIVPGLHVASFS